MKGGKEVRSGREVMRYPHELRFILALYPIFSYILYLQSELHLSPIINYSVIFILVGWVAYEDLIMIYENKSILEELILPTIITNVFGIIAFISLYGFLNTHNFIYFILIILYILFGIFINIKSHSKPPTCN